MTNRHNFTTYSADNLAKDSSKVSRKIFDEQVLLYFSIDEEQLKNM